MALLKSQKRDLDLLRQEVAEANNIKDHVQQMFDDGVLTQDENGAFRAVIDPKEKEHLQEQMAYASKQKFGYAAKKGKEHI